MKTKVKKTIEVYITECDFCMAEIKDDYITRCICCGKDVCAKCSDKQNWDLSKEQTLCKVCSKEFDIEISDGRIVKLRNVTTGFLLVAPYPNGC